jgi:hypothetical protein
MVLLREVKGQDGGVEYIKDVRLYKVLLRGPIPAAEPIPHQDSWHFFNPIFQQQHVDKDRKVPAQA